MTRAMAMADLTDEMRREVFDLRARGCTSEEIVAELRIAFDVEVDWSVISQLCRSKMIDRPGRVVMAVRRPSIGTLKRRVKGVELPLKGGSNSADRESEL